MRKHAANSKRSKALSSNISCPCFSWISNSFKTFCVQLNAFTLSEVRAVVLVIKNVHVKLVGHLFGRSSIDSYIAHGRFPFIVVGGSSTIAGGGFLCESLPVFLRRLSHFLRDIPAFVGHALQPFGKWHVFGRAVEVIRDCQHVVMDVLVGYGEDEPTAVRELNNIGFHGGVSFRHHHDTNG